MNESYTEKYIYIFVFIKYYLFLRISQESMKASGRKEKKEQQNNK